MKPVTEDVAEEPTLEALGAGRYYRAYVADKLDGEWYPIEGFDTPEKPFAGKANMSFEPGVTPWSTQVSHGEMIRDGNDERMVLDRVKGKPVYLGLAMDARKRVKMKPQNLLTNLPIVPAA